MNHKGEDSSLGLFLVGVTDSLSVRWVRGVLLYSDPQNKRILPASKLLLRTLLLSVVQVGLLLTIIPLLLDFLGLELLAWIVGQGTLLLTYGYLFFYNNDILNSAQEVVRWRRKRDPVAFPEEDLKQKRQFFTDLSNQVQSFIFLVLFYVPIFVGASLFAWLQPSFGLLVLVLSESFFNSVFCYLRKWPYDLHNVAFLETKLTYFIGNGLIISIVCNILLQGPWARAAYFLLTQSGIINAVIFSPPTVESLSLGCRAVFKEDVRNVLPNAYSLHRQRLNNEQNYRRDSIKRIRLLLPLVLITERLNSRLRIALSVNPP